MRCCCGADIIAGRGITGGGGKNGGALESEKGGGNFGSCGKSCGKKLWKCGKNSDKKVLTYFDLCAIIET